MKDHPTFKRVNTFHTYQRKKILQNTFCFECRERVTKRLPGDMVVLLNHYSYFFHATCAERILSAHVVEQLNREIDLEEKFSLKRNAEKLTDRLGYRKT